MQQVIKHLCIKYCMVVCVCVCVYTQYLIVDASATEAAIEKVLMQDFDQVGDTHTHTHTHTHRPVQALQAD